ncbi:MAG: TauD/TfdA family dioxygenase [Deltaproteobacteria bacterium]|nr:TauD/TfdA family dioxygenase [Deltaproteobacteria bacterium]
MGIEISEALEPFGAIVTGWRPGEDLAGGELETIRSALQEHLVLVFREHRAPADAELVRFARHFGDLVKGTEWFGDIVEFPEILPITNRIGDDGIAMGTGGAAEFPWHADYSYVPRPGKESFLEAVELPERPPRTCFCSQYVALETLPNALAEPLRERSAFHSITEFEPDDGPEIMTGMSEKRERDARLGIERPGYPEAVHPVIFSHPESGRKALYVSPGITRYVLGLPRDESDALLAELHEHSTRPERVYAHEWQAGDLVVFDTVGAMHRRDGWTTGEPRFMRQLSSMC